MDNLNTDPERLIYFLNVFGGNSRVWTFLQTFTVRGPASLHIPLTNVSVQLGVLRVYTFKLLTLVFS